MSVTVHVAGGRGEAEGLGVLLPGALHTQPFEVSGSDLADAVEAGVQVSGGLGKRRDAF